MIENELICKMTGLIASIEKCPPILLNDKTNTIVMIKDVDELKEQRIDLVELFEGMDREQLLNQCYLECIDAINMDGRVSVFMEECTLNLSKTTYDISSIKDMIQDKQEANINEFCYDVLSDSENDAEVIDEIYRRSQID